MPGATQSWFAAHLLAWFDLHGRKDLPWQRDPTPYRVWVSEVMLQQTQVRTVIPYYQRFIERFPDLASLAAADLDDVLNLWTGLGYYARARNLHRAARQIAQNGETFPATVEGLQALPGLGRSTAAAVLALAHGRRAAILDGNVKRVLSRFHAIDGDIGRTTTLRKLWHHADAHTPSHRVSDYTQAIMDLGATVCLRKTPRCTACPVAKHCKGLSLGRMEDFPVRRRSGDKPVRKVRMYVISNRHGGCLLERRTHGGIWGGLWTPPQRGIKVSPAQVCRELGIDERTVATRRVSPVFRHTFSHFHLDIEPHHLVLTEQPALVAERDDRRWHHPAHDRDFGVPAPVIKLFDAVLQINLEDGGSV